MWLIKFKIARLLDVQLKLHKMHIIITLFWQMISSLNVTIFLDITDYYLTK